jgi:hypothetical protein
MEDRLWLSVEFPENVTSKDVMESKSATKVIVVYCHEWCDCPDGRAYRSGFRDNILNTFSSL